MPARKAGHYYGLSSAGGLGWGFGAALGAKLAAPDKLVVATLGDGAYMFSNPMVAHWVSDVHKLPILTIIFNNSRYGAVRGATMSMFKDGAAGLDNGQFMADLNPSPAFEMAVKAQGGYGERVECRRSAGRSRARPRRGDKGGPSGAPERDLPLLKPNSAVAGFLPGQRKSTRSKLKRRSIYIDEFSHQSPIPNASRISNILVSGLLRGVDPKTGNFPATLEQQCAFMFENIRRTAEAAALASMISSK